MDDRTMRIWYDQVYKPYITESDGASGLLFDKFVSQKSKEFKNKVDTHDYILYIIPPN